MAPFALISDIHSNVWALEAVLSDIFKRGIHSVINLGDSLYGSIDPAATAALLRDNRIHSICGNQDRILLQDEADPAGNQSLLFTRSALKAAHFDWIESLPGHLQRDGVFCAVHGSLYSDETYWLEDISRGFMTSKSEEALAKTLIKDPLPYYFCGHSHRPGFVRIAQTTIVNPGSVGLQAYRDDLPRDHIMQNGSPHARYCIIGLREQRELSAEQIILPYPWDKAAHQARVNGRPDWVRYLTSGRAD